MSARKPANRQTIAASHAINTDTSHRAVVPPLYLSANFSFRTLGEKGDYDYTRSGHPNRDQLAEALARMESGCGAVITSSGMSAAHLVTQLVRPGERLLAPLDCYGGCHRMLNAGAGKGHFELHWEALWETPRAIHAIRSLRPSLVWIESPSNPLLRVTDIRALARAAHEVGAVVVVDNTFLSPVGQSPIELGADIVIHSTTKYINGHSDIVGGAVIAANPELLEPLEWWANCLGLTGAPFDAFQTLRGLRTLGVRFSQQQASASAVANFLQEQPLVRKVYYPGLESHPAHALARSQQHGFGAVVSFELDAPLEAIKVLLEALELFTLAESLGGVESLVAHPASMTHSSMSGDDLHAAGITRELLRLSVGIEAEADLLQDLSYAFAALERFVAAERRSGRLALA